MNQTILFDQSLLDLLAFVASKIGRDKNILANELLMMALHNPMFSELLLEFKKENENGQETK